MIGKIAHLAPFLVGLFATGAWVRSLEVMPFWSWSRAKLDHLRRQGDAYDTVFLGSSRMHYGIEPSTFDAATAEVGRPTKSFNAALSGMRMHDTLLMGEWLLSNKPANVNHLVVELHGFEQSIRGEQWLTDQDFEMHSPEVLGMRLRSLWVSRQPASQRIPQFGYVLIHTLCNALRVGQGVRILNDRAALTKGWSMPGAGPVKDAGWEAIERAALPHQRQYHDEFTATQRPFEAAVATRLAEPIPEWARGGWRADVILVFAERATAAGVATTFVVMPSVGTDFLGRDEVDSLRGKVRLLEFDFPLTNRSMYEPEYYYDPSHLTTEGARTFSRKLAKHLVAPAAAPTIDVLSERAVTLAARWDPEQPGSVVCSATNLPFLGDAVLMIADRRGAAPVGENLAVGVALPPLAQKSLPRTGLATAAGIVASDKLPTDRPLFVQVGIVHTTGVIALSDVVELAPPK
ncbi:MAG: hypothetical protein RL398_2197 [Planctomycetota bacterium]